MNDFTYTTLIFKYMIAKRVIKLLITIKLLLEIKSTSSPCIMIDVPNVGHIFLVNNVNIILDRWRIYW